MQSQEEKLRLFMEAINSYAEQQRLSIMYETDRFTNAEMEQAEAEALSDAYSLISKETAEVRASVVRELSAYELSARRRLFGERVAIENEVFAEARQRLTEFAAGGEYERYLTAAAKKTAQVMSGSDVVVRVRPADEGKAALFAGMIPGCRVETDASILIGGFTAENTVRGALVDMTLDSRLEQQRESFRRSAGLTIEE